ncbi:BolA family protein [Tumidithrix helvetica PCC 7403]|uniref:BolA family protein n=1 Tax=Tumidithrix elongata BACA0141 TaxID=2716417 RepID=A0AAW9Q3S3_9CYAN|nr:BolA family protein [Tumidithrix elongata RA019]
MKTLNQIQAILQEKLQAEYVEITDRSHEHQHHKGRMDAPVGSGHYDAVIVSNLFLGKTIMQQHRMVYEALSEQMQTTIHALSLKTYSPKQWSAIDH